ncbi:MAG TPA: penicillin-binding protein 2 [Candidatus Paceibacterota bacterium]
MNSNVSRVRILLAFLFLWAFILSLKLYSVQIVNGENYAKQADKQYVKPISSVFERGSIFFETKNGTRISAALIREGYSLIMNPKLIKNPDFAYEALSQYVKIDRDIFMQKALKLNDQYEELKKHLDEKTGISIGELDIPGINVIKENWRVYPGGSLASHTIGLVGYDKTDKIAGRYGLERYYENILGRTEKSANINFFAELFANISGDIFKGPRKEGNIVATIEPVVQDELEKTLKKTQDMWNSDSIGGIIMNPKTGEIYAMANRPTFDINNLNDEKDPHVFSNQLVEGVHEMGSIIKPLTMAVGIDSKVITPESTYDDTGFLLLNGKRIANWDGKDRGIIPMQEILNQSLNIGAANIALKVGSDDFTRYFLSFGLGELTGIDQPNEVRGKVNNLKTGREIEQATASYGQGIALSPIATARALSIVANGGLLIQPHIVKRIEYADDVIEDINIDSGIRVIQKETSEEVTKMLVEVVDKALRKGAVKMTHYSIAAKTGTAQIADPVNGGYYGDRYLHSFFGYFPAYSPKYIIFLYHVYPKGAGYASETLTDPFMELTKFLINYYEVPPDR